MKQEKKEYDFRNAGDKELNDVVYPGQPFELLYHSYKFVLTPYTRFWRFGIRFSTNNVVQFSPAGRYVNANYPDLQIAVGDRPSDEWINPNKIELGNYHYFKGYEKQNPFSVCNSYKIQSPVTVDLVHNTNTNVITISYSAEGCSTFQKELQVGDYRYFKIFAWADYIDFHLNCLVTVADYRYLSLPLQPLSTFDEKWLNILCDSFFSEKEIISEFDVGDLWKAFPKDYNPRGINPLLVENGTKITLYGIYHINPLSKIFENFDKIIFAIRKKLEDGNIPQRVSSREIGELLPELTQEEIRLSIKQVTSLRNFSRGLSQEADKTMAILINDPEILQNYKVYVGLQPLLFNFLGQLDAIKNQNGTITQPTAERKLNTSIRRTSLGRLAQKDIKPVMGVLEIASIIADILEGLTDDQGQMIGIFGRWGRGKTFLLNQLFAFLSQKEKLRGKKTIHYHRVDFPAWKYQDTPASWAHLYEVLADHYLGEKKHIFVYYWRLIRLNFNRHKFGPLLSFLVASLATIALPIFGSPHFKDKFLFWLGITPAFLTLALTILKQLQKPLSTKATDLTKKYGTRHSFKATLGIQAEIQDELLTLVKTWIPQNQIGDNKILLNVEDLDRCSEDKIIENIDALRVMLDNDEIANRLIIITAVDERILKNAIRIKYEKLYSPQTVNSSINQLISEYLDKLFISAIKLSDLNSQQKGEFVDVLLAKYLPSSSEKQTTLATELPPHYQMKKPDYSPPHIHLNVPTESGERILFLPGNENSDRAKQLQNAALTVTSIPVEGFTNDERNFFKAAIENWIQATPRSLMIYYYRYLLCKNLLITQYQKLEKINIWQDESNIRGLLAAILEFSSLHEPSAIQAKRKDILQQEAPLTVPIAKDHASIDKLDYLNMLEILEIVISY